MSSNINAVTVTGNVTRDIDVRVTQSGTSVGLISLACNEGFKNPTSGKWEERANYFDCVIFGDRARKLEPYIKKGTKIAIHGHLRYSSWEKDGQKRSKVQIIVDKLELLNSKKNDTKSDTNTSDFEDYACEDIPF